MILALGLAQQGFQETLVVYPDAWATLGALQGIHT